jgi:hypothetical protein
MGLFVLPMCALGEQTISGAQVAGNDFFEIVLMF